MTDVRVQDNATEKRYDAWLGDQLAGSAFYDTADDLIVFTHTEVDDVFEGHGVGSALARAGLDDARAKGQRVIARCPFIKSWIDHHPDYQDLLD